MPGTYPFNLGRGGAHLKNMGTYLDEIWRPLGVGIGAGRVFFVNGTDWGNGADDYPGTDPDKPLATIAEALDKCVTERHDRIVVLDYWANDSFPIVVNKSCVHIIGMTHGGVVGIWPIMNAGAKAVFQIGSNPHAEIAGFSLITDASNPCINVVGGECKAHIHHVAFGEHGIAQDGILSEAGQEFNNSLVENCLFGRNLGRDGLRLYSPSWTWIANNLFRKYGKIGVNINGPSSARLGGIIDNKFFQKIGGDKGCAITITAAQNGIIDGNHAMEDAETPGNVPYVDLTTGTKGTTKNAWGLNYSGGSAVEPLLTLG